MAVITPQSDIYLLKCPIEISEDHQLTFGTKQAQYAYFSNLTRLTVDNFTYIRKDGVLRFPGHFDNIVQFNYVMYRNDAFSDKWFYAFIENVQYLNDNTVAITLKTDVWQTWQFDLQYKKMFVEREHVSDDGVGNNTIDEGLETGEPVINSSRTIKPDLLVRDANNDVITGLKFAIVFQVSELASGIGVTSTMYNSAYNGVFSGLKYFAVTDYSNARDIISKYDADGKGDSIISIFLAPREFLAGARVFGETGYNIYIPYDNGRPTQLTDITTVSRPSTVNGYHPKNNKLLSYPYSYCYVTNNAGVETVFRYEDFASTNPTFYLAGALGQGCTTKLCPVSYKSYTSNTEVFEYGVIGAKYPVCAWSSDYYTNWVAQNAVNNVLGVGEAAFSAGAGIAGPAVAGLASTGFGMAVAGAAIFSSVLSAMGQHYQAMKMPDQAKGNVNSSDLLVGWERYFTVDCMSVRAEVARTIDDYFSMYGYKVNRLKIPNIHTRSNWNFVKTIGCYIEGDVPQEDLNEIKQMFDKGITFWHKTGYFLDYSQANTVI